MEIDLANLPEDAQALKALVQQLVGTVKTQGLKIAQLEARLAKLKRMQFRTKPSCGLWAGTRRIL